MNHRDTLREIDWHSICPWLILTRALRLAFHGRVLLMATIGLIVATAGFAVVGQFFAEEIDGDPLIAEWKQTDARWQTWPPNAWRDRPALAIPADQIDGLDAKPADHRKFDETTWWSAASFSLNWLYQSTGGFVAAWERLVRPVARIFDRRLTLHSFAYSLMCGVWALLVWSFVGGAITRIAALYLTRGELPGLRASGEHAASRLVSFIAAPVAPIVIMAFISIPLMLLGWLIQWEIFAILASAFWWVALAMGLLLAIFAIGVMVGWPLMWATISVERTDAFDAFSRSFAYVYQRPIRLFFYVIVSVGLCLIGIAIISAFAHITVHLSERAIEATAGGATFDAFRGRSGVQFWYGVFATIVTAFPIGFLWTASVAIYLLMRRDIDAAEMDEVALEEQLEAYGTPQLAPHPSGVPEVVQRDPSSATDAKDRVE